MVDDGILACQRVSAQIAHAALLLMHERDHFTDAGTVIALLILPLPPLAVLVPVSRRLLTDSILILCAPPLSTGPVSFPAFHALVIPAACLTGLLRVLHAVAPPVLTIARPLLFRRLHDQARLARSASSSSRTSWLWVTLRSNASFRSHWYRSPGSQMVVWRLSSMHIQYRSGVVPYSHEQCTDHGHDVPGNHLLVSARRPRADHLPGVGPAAPHRRLVRPPGRHRDRSALPPPRRCEDAAGTACARSGRTLRSRWRDHLARAPADVIALGRSRHWNPGA